MPRTPDFFPGQRLEEDLRLLATGSLPTQNGQIHYSSGTVSGSGFFFMEEGTVKRLGLSGISHETEPTLAHSVVSSSYDEAFYDNSSRLSQYIVWGSAAKTRKYQQYDLQYTGSSNLVQALTASQYDATGSLSYTVLEVPTYNTRNRIVAVTRTRIG